MVSILGKAALEDETVDKFLYFCKHVQSTLLQPDEILGAQDFDKQVALRLKRIIKGDGQGKRTDRLKTICTRLYLHVTQDSYKPQENHKDNIIKFLLSKDMDAPILFNLHRLIANSNSKVAKELMRDARLAKYILKSL